MMDTLLDVGRFLIGFLPWILFLYLPTNGWEPLRRAVLMCLAASIVFSLKALRERFILQWATVAFFLFCAISFYGFNWVWLANHMSVVANLVLDAIIWLSILAGKPFTLQYAKAEAPSEIWHTEAFLRGCRSIAVFWGALLLVPSALSLLDLFYPAALPKGFHFFITPACMVLGIVWTTLFKRAKRRQRTALGAQAN
jgi:carotenoid cleavage dioxygenase